jgi:hypothetical protein
MKKFVVIIALLILILGVISLLISETRLEEQVIDEWNPIKPSKLYPYWNETANEYNSTGYRFIDRAEGNNTKFRQLLERGEISEIFLELNVTASSPVRVRVGKLFYNSSSGKVDVVNATFNEEGVYIAENVRVQVINGSANANYLEIANENVNSVDISGYIKLKAKMPEVFHPFYGFGTLMCLLGFSLAAYGLLAKPKRKRALTRATYAIRDFKVKW